MKKYSIFWVFCGLLFFLSGNAQQNTSHKKSSLPKKLLQNSFQQKNFSGAEIQWTGTVNVEENYSGLIGLSERHIDISFSNALPTLNRNIETTDFNFTDDKGNGNVKEHTETFITEKNKTTGEETQKPLSVCDCSGQGQAELHEVVINKLEGTYTFSVIPPPCKGGNSTDGTCGGQSWDIVISDKPLGSDPFTISGKETNYRDLTIGKLTTTITWNLKGCPPWNDPQTRMNGLKAKVKEAASRFIKRVHDELCLKLKVASGLRTNHEQDILYDIGRKTPPPSKTVTNLKGGASYHNYGLAIDVYLVKNDGTLDLDTRIPPEVAKIGKEEGFKWGGDWDGTLIDYPHFEMTLGQSIKELKKQNGTP